MSAEAPALRVGLIGCGNISAAHARAYGMLDQAVARVVATADVMEGLAERRARELQADRWSSDYREVLADPAVEAVDICLPHHVHAEVALAAARAGKHVLVEKPMAISMAECRSMVDAADRAGVILMVAQNQRYEPSYRGVRRLVDDGELGPIRAVRFDSMQDLHTILPAGHWLYDGALAGGGIVISVSVHRIDLMRYLIGDVRRVFAVCHRGEPPYRNEAEDYASAVLEFANGAVGEHFATYSGFRMPYSESFMIFGDDGAVHALPEPYTDRGPAFYATRTHSAPTQEESAWKRMFTGFLPVEPDPRGLPTGNSFANEIAHFAACCRTGQAPLSSGRDNLGTMATIFAIYQSARTNTWVALSGVQ